MIKSTLSRNRDISGRLSNPTSALSYTVANSDADNAATRDVGGAPSDDPILPVGNESRAEGEFTGAAADPLTADGFPAGERGEETNAPSTSMNVLDTVLPISMSGAVTTRIISARSTAYSTAVLPFRFRIALVQSIGKMSLSFHYRK